MTDQQSTRNSQAWRNSPEFAAFQRKTTEQSQRVADKNTADKFLGESPAEKSCKPSRERVFA